MAALTIREPVTDRVTHGGWRSIIELAQTHAVVNLQGGPPARDRYAGALIRAALRRSGPGSDAIVTAPGVDVRVRLDVDEWAQWAAANPLPGGAR